MRPRVVLDTNILISALVFGGKPKEILLLALNEKVVAFTSPNLNAELVDVLVKKFNFSLDKIKSVERKLKKHLRLVHPAIEIHILEDEPDNRILEVATETRCDYVVSGDKKLLELKKYKDIKIVRADEFLNLHKNPLNFHIK